MQERSFVLMHNMIYGCAATNSLPDMTQQFISVILN